ncbi:DUF5590 domain-containing protein [Heyndrickxia ginsengihumi]|uniref:Cell wall elongation regulator TseB-like domain-containing protein n=1 Tax=Heyndrickxia ginsengihumi TaxID=363870 RepID=A0A6M0P7F4_9BACI|nr:DUF5590 domain-containing protein [Heyndrickxia ginsengihumi]MBE6185527.1 hypothetical protein [Bacillus sp. (in: firmicutes)]MCM3022948.1 DUF5590 domain-containing protein [Heyndrickxia ginsengihumi]NEY20624.1 hypothetical protein [Heyndrickxia ginsengihumi]
MKKVLLAVGIIVAVIIVFTVTVYSQARKPYNDAYQYAQKIAGKEAHIQSVDQFYLYSGSTTYYVVVGKNNKKQEMVVWIPKKHPHQFKTMKWKDGISKTEAMNTVKRSKNPDKILSVRLGMDDQTAIWEVAYEKGNNLNYYEVPFAKHE